MRWLLTALTALCLGTGFLSLPTQAEGEAPAEPELRIEAGMHTAILRHIAVGPGDQFVVSSSFDKTIRIWNLPDGKLERIIRVPIGQGFEGSVYAVAVSPDGKTIAASGWFKQQFLYLIDVGTGAIIKTLGPNPITANTIAFSPDGTKVATVLSRNFGVRLYDVATGALLTEDKSAADDTYGLAFRADGSFATTSFDGKVRLYDPSGTPLATLDAPGGRKPYSVAFTPDGRKMALGYNDTNRVDILAVDVREWLVPPNVEGIEGGTLQAVQWSRDGTLLFAGGSNWAEGYYQVWRWKDQGKGERSLAFRNSDAIFDIQQYDQQGIAVGAALPAISIIAHEKLLMHLESPTAGMGRGEKGVLTTNEAGTQIRFALDLAGFEPIMFDMTTLELKDMKGLPDDLDPPITGSLYVEDWYGKLQPKLGTKLLTLDPHETSYSLAISRDKGSFILGTAWYLRKFSGAGDLLWRTVIGGLARGVTLVKGDKVAIAALSDGTIRWYRMSDGNELMALFVHSTDKRWIVWSPKGYYAASPGGDELIGWHVNRGDAEVPDFFAAARFREPLLPARCRGEDARHARRGQGDRGGQRGCGPREREAAGRRRARPSPRRHRAGDGLERDQDGDVAGPDFLPRALAKRRADRSHRDADRRPPARGPRGDRHSRRERCRHHRRPRSLQGFRDRPHRTNQDRRERSHDRQGEVGRRLRGTAEAEALRRGGGGQRLRGYRPQAEIRRPGCEGFRRSAPAPGRRHLWQGRGQAADRREGVARRYRRSARMARRRSDARAMSAWCSWPVTASPTTSSASTSFPSMPTWSRLRSSAVSRDDLLATMSGLAGKALMFIDACHSATASRASRTRGAGADITQVVNELSSAENGVVMFASSTGRQLSIENDTWKNGAFTEALIEGLSGDADYVTDGKLTIAELDLWLSDRVKVLTDKRQAPVVRKPDTIPDFPIALVR